ncbi:MAG: helix-turn-helix domain-containing protein [Oscillospiraceae bacterium]|nr:helix-turn-helix domain-containing protein [Oscillospiraceae bacterium]
MLGIGRNQAYKLIHQNIIPHRDIGRQHRIKR